MGDCDGDMADNLYSEKYFQRDCKEILGDRYVVQIFYNIFGYPDVPVHSFLRKSWKEQGIGGWIWNNVFGICRKRILDVELRCNYG